MHLRQPNDRHPNATLAHRSRHILRLPRYRVQAQRRIAFHAHVARAAARKSCTGGHHQQLAWLKHRAQYLNCVAFIAPVLGKLRHIVMAERQVHHHIHPPRSATQALQILQVAVMDLHAGCLQLFRAFLAACQPAYLVPGLYQLLHQLGPDETCRSRYKNPHSPLLSLLFAGAAAMRCTGSLSASPGVSGISGDRLRTQAKWRRSPFARSSEKIG